MSTYLQKFAWNNSYKLKLVENSFIFSVDFNITVESICYHPAKLKAQITFKLILIFRIFFVSILKLKEKITRLLLLGECDCYATLLIVKMHFLMKKLYVYLGLGVWIFYHSWNKLNKDLFYSYLIGIQNEFHIWCLKLQTALD